MTNNFCEIVQRKEIPNQQKGDDLGRILVH